MPVDEQAAESSTALDAEFAEAATSDFERYSAIGDARDVAAKTGQAIVEVPPASEKPASEIAAESEPAKPVQETAKPKNAETRKAELKAEIDELLKQRAALKAPETPGEKPADPPPASGKPKEAKVAAKAGEPVAPDLDTWTGTFAEFRVAEKAYVSELLDFKLAEHRATETAAVANKAIESGLNDAQTAAREEFADFDEVALSKDTPISNVMDGWILKNLPVSMKVLYRLGENSAAEAKRISALDAYDQLDALAEIRSSFKTAKTPPVKKHTTAAPAPATDLGGRNAEPSDQAHAALLTNDFSRYEREANARDLKALRG